MRQLPNRIRPHDHSHAFGGFHAREREGLVLATRRNMIKASLAGIAGLSLPGLLERECAGADDGRPAAGAKSIARCAGPEGARNPATIRAAASTRQSIAPIVNQ